MTGLLNSLPAVVNILRFIPVVAYRVTLHIVNSSGTEFTPHCIFVVVDPPTNTIDLPAPWPATVLWVAVPADTAPVLPRHVCPAHLLSNFYVPTFQSVASDVMYGRPTNRFCSKSVKSIAVYVPAAHATHSCPLAPVCPGRHSHDKIEGLAIAEVELAGQALQDCIGWLAYMLVALACAACKSAVFPCSSAVKAKAIKAKALFGMW